ncbi:MAG: hypothetical protein ACE5F3_00435 [Mariprofundaceae bacterium]
MDSNQLGVFDPVSRSFREYDIPTIDSHPYRIAADSKGNIWFTEFYGNKIGMFDPRKEVFSEYVIPTPSSRPSGIAADQKGFIWFIETEGNKLGRLDPKDGAIVEFELPLPFEAPGDVVVDDSGVIWFGGRKGHSLIMFNAATESFDAFPMPNRGVSESLAVAKDGKIICTLKTSSNIALFDPEKRAFLEVNGAMGKSKPNGIDVDSKGNIWFADTPRNALFKMDIAMVRKLWEK